MVPFYKGRLEVAHDAASNLKGIGDAKKSLIAYARVTNFGLEHIQATPNPRACASSSETKNVTRARPEFLKRLKFVQGDADDFTVRNTLHVFEVVVSVYRGRKEWLARRFH